MIVDFIMAGLAEGIGDADALGDGVGVGAGVDSTACFSFTRKEGDEK